MGFSHGSLTLNEKHLGKQREDGVRSKRRTYPKARQRRNGYPGAGLFCDVEARSQRSASSSSRRSSRSTRSETLTTSSARKPTRITSSPAPITTEPSAPKKITGLPSNASRNCKLTTSSKETGSREKPNLERPAWR